MFIQNGTRSFSTELSCWVLTYFKLSVPVDVWGLNLWISPTTGSGRNHMVNSMEDLKPGVILSILMDIVLKGKIHR